MDCLLNYTYHVDVLLTGGSRLTVSTDIKERIVTMGHLFVSEGLVNPYIPATDRAL